MSYNRILLALVSAIAGCTAIYFFSQTDNQSKLLGWFALVILLTLNVFYYFFSNDWLNARRDRHRKKM